MFLLFLVVLGPFCCAGSFSSSRKRASLCIRFSLLWSMGSRACGFHYLWHVSSVVVTPRFESTGSTVVAHRLHCSVARGLIPDRRSNSRLLHWQVDSLPLCRQGSPCGLCFIGKVQSSSFLSLGRLYNLRKMDSS